MYNANCLSTSKFSSPQSAGINSVMFSSIFVVKGVKNEQECIVRMSNNDLYSIIIHLKNPDV